MINNEDRPDIGRCCLCDQQGYLSLSKLPEGYICINCEELLLTRRSTELAITEIEEICKINSGDNIIKNILIDLYMKGYLISKHRS